MLAEAADFCPNCVIRPTPAAVYGFQLRPVISAAPSLNPVISNVMGLPAAGAVNLPSVPKVSVPVAPGISKGVPAVPAVTSSPGIVTL